MILKMECFLIGFKLWVTHGQNFSISFWWSQRYIPATSTTTPKSQGSSVLLLKVTHSMWGLLCVRRRAIFFSLERFFGALFFFKWVEVFVLQCCYKVVRSTPWKLERKLWYEAEPIWCITTIFTWNITTPVCLSRQLTFVAGPSSIRCVQNMHSSNFLWMERGLLWS